MTIRRAPTQFLNDKHGNVLITFAIAGLPLLLVVGASVDYARGISERTTVQQIADSTALLLSSDDTNLTASTATLNTKSQTLINAEAGGRTLTVAWTTLNTSTSEFCVKVNEAVPTTIMKMVRVTSMPVSAQACSRRQGHFEVALALDNTGSMSASAGSATKLQSLITATKSLVSIMQPTGLAKPMTSFSIVPFAAAVNIGNQNASKSFMDLNGQSSIHWNHFAFPSSFPAGYPKPTNRLVAYQYMYGNTTSWKGCVEERPYPYTVSDDKANQSIPDTLYVPYLYPDEPGDATGTTTYTNGGKSYSSVNSYLTDTAGGCSPGDSFQTADAADPISKGSGLARVCKYANQQPASVTSGTSGFPAGPSLGCEAEQILPLTEDMTSIANEINGMTANGDTNTMTGLMWAWRTISPNGPFNTTADVAGGPRNARPYTDQNNTKVIVLMTDGANHWATPGNAQFLSTYNALGYMVDNRLSATTDKVSTTGSNYRSQMDKATLLACQNARAAGIAIYTVGFSVAAGDIDAAGVNLLQQCAGTPSGQNSNMAYIATNANDIVVKFQAIAKSLSQLRLTK